MPTLKSSVAAAPAPYLVTLLGSAAALAVTFGHLNAAQSAALYSLAMAAGTVFTAARTRTISVAVISGAAGLILGDLTLIGYPALSADQKGAAVALLTFGVGSLLHLLHVPVSDSAPGPAIGGGGGGGGGTPAAQSTFQSRYRQPPAAP